MRLVPDMSPGLGRIVNTGEYLDLVEVMLPPDWAWPWLLVPTAAAVATLLVMRHHAGGNLGTRPDRRTGQMLPYDPARHSSVQDTARPRQRTTAGCADALNQVLDGDLERWGTSGKARRATDRGSRLRRRVIPVRQITAVGSTMGRAVRRGTDGVVPGGIPGGRPPAGAVIYCSSLTVAAHLVERRLGAYAGEYHVEALLEQLVIDTRGSVVVLADPADPSFMTVASEFAQDAWGISSGSRFR